MEHTNRARAFPGDILIYRGKSMGIPKKQVKAMVIARWGWKIKKVSPSQKVKPLSAWFETRIVCY
jgi:hypothetical protein